MNTIAMDHERTRLWRFAPLLTVMLALILDLVAFPSTAPSTLMPSLSLGVVFYWSLMRFELISPLVIFIVGIILDVMSGLPIGITSLSMVLAIGLLATADRNFIAGSFVVMWGCFVLVALLMFLARWFVASLWWGRVFSIEDAMVEAAMTIIVFPVIGWLGGMIEPLVPKDWHASRD